VLTIRSRHTIYTNLLPAVENPDNCLAFTLHGGHRFIPGGNSILGFHTFHSSLEEDQTSKSKPEPHFGYPAERHEPMTFVVIILVTAVTGLSQAMDIAMHKNCGGYRHPSVNMAADDIAGFGPQARLFTNDDC
jgi:hypothetical protein